MDCQIYLPSENQYYHDYLQCNYDLGLEYIYTWSKETPFLIDKKHLNKLYTLLFQEEMKYRIDNTTIISAGKVIHLGPDPNDIQALMNTFFKDINELLESKDYDAAYKSGMAQIRFFYIHPLENYNGHIGRFLSNVILLHENKPIVQMDSKASSFYSTLIHEHDISKNPNMFISYWRKLVEEAEEKQHE